jgi:hypothetical protein
MPIHYQARRISKSEAHELRKTGGRTVLLNGYHGYLVIEPRGSKPGENVLTGGG